MKQLLKTFAIFAMFAGAFASCDEETDCSMVGRGMMKCVLFERDLFNETFAPATLTEVTVKADGTDSVIINRQQNAKDLLLPLRYASDSTKLTLHYSEEPDDVDTLVLYHTNTPFFVAMDCGIQMKQNITGCRFSGTRIDSISITNPELSPYGQENIQIYY